LPSLTPTSHQSLVEVSVDGTYFFHAQVFFEYRIPPLFLDVSPIRLSVWGEVDLQIEGKNFILGTVPICRFIFPSSIQQVDLAGQLVSKERLICFCPRHLLIDEEIILQLSFNNQEFYEVTSIENTLIYPEKARITSIYPTFGFAN